MNNINKKVVTLTLGLMAFGSFLNAGECKVRVGFSNNALDNKLRGSVEYVIHHKSTLTTKKNHMRKVKNHGGHDVKVSYWDITGHHKKTVKKGKTAWISGDLKEVTCLTKPVHSYRLDCVAGGDMVATYFKHRLTTKFKSGADYKHLRKGECAWHDRKLRSNEPRKICQGITDFKFVKTRRGYTATSAHATYLRKMQTGGKFSVQVRKKNNCFNVIHVLR